MLLMKNKIIEGLQHFFIQTFRPQMAKNSLFVGAVVTALGHTRRQGYAVLLGTNSGSGSVEIIATSNHNESLCLHSPLLILLPARPLHRAAD